MDNSALVVLQDWQAQVTSGGTGSETVADLNRNGWRFGIGTGGGIHRNTHVTTGASAKTPKASELPGVNYPELLKVIVGRQSERIDPFSPAELDRAGLDRTQPGRLGRADHRVDRARP